MKLVIAEKPSVAMSLAAVLGATERKDGYLEGSGYLVSWCVGHLLELAQPEAYKEQYAKWRYEDLPILPENWKYEVPKDKKTQLALLCRLMKDKRVDSVVCATDAGREGELIFRLVYEYAGCNKPMERLWISSMEDAAIREGFDHLRPGSDYDKLYDAAVCRAGADWLIGINATRLFSVLYGVTLNVGRVMSPTLALLVQRESDIESFISKPFYVPEITCGGFTASGEKMTERSEAEKIRMDCDHNSAFVRSVEKQVKTIQPPRLYDLTTLQRECNRIYGYTAQQTLDYVQSLYEKKLATYPRTDSQYLTKDMQATAASLILWLRDNMPFGKGCAGEPDIDRVTDDSKVTDHHAIIPTVEIARTDLSELPSGERDVLTLLAVRLLCATTQANRFEAVTAMLDCQGYTFTAKGKTILQSGWKEVERIHRMSIRQSETEHRENEDAALPVLKEGQTFETVSASLREGKTSPPKHYTEDTLLSAMETAGAEDMPDDAKRKGLGTPATRAATLEKLVSAGFVQRKKKQLISTEKGRNLIAVLPDNIKSPILTAEWESMLKQVEHGELSATSFMDQIADMSRTLVKEHTAPEKRFADLFPSSRETAHEAVGVCPRCGAPVYEGKKGFFCDNRECSFALWKDNRFFSSKKKSITKSVAAALLKEGRISMSGLYSEKTGKTYDAEVILDDTGGKYVNFKLEFPVKKGRRK
ncbi:MULTISPECIES: DNA topoisomerase 3 [Clostridia]|uniref:DNA topoisomerase n=1 Tax=Dorea formicigenerans TaxID=39486 RepID=A0A415MZK9_9FIRM|nr:MULTISPECIES: DNA topoisomerase 3 [Clostridia]RHU81362.1 DNA topoisomerase III [Clostridiaceae bacterium OM08-6BH]RHL87994.1 DNA topoisomerase III [Dorea formicigenerans]RHP99514.1 DNA topoisomerase III [Roseburia sp. AM51-8]RHR23087.1 DNA topoisomerase III [Blautia sp. AF19-13LB]RHR49958.1 DNA topoisomerase III [Blautia sp. AF17-9LB]